MKTNTDIRTQRTMLNFGILVIVATATAIFILYKAQEAIEEMEAISAKHKLDINAMLDINYDKQEENK